VAELVRYLLLGLLQGATEFLPVSSSGHLVAARALLSLQVRELFFEVCMHAGTLVAILVVFRREIRDLVVDAVKGVALVLTRRPWREVLERAPLFGMAVAIVIGTIPAALFGLLCRDAISRFFEGDLRVTGALMMVTGLVLLASRHAPKGTAAAVGPLRGLMVGVAQAVALLPGISRSGFTIVAGCFLGLDRKVAARFSFLLAVPALVGAMALEGGRALTSPGLAAGGAGAELAAQEVAGLLCGMVAAALAGTACLVLLLRVIQGGRLHWFAAYCLPLGALLAGAGFLA